MKCGISIPEEREPMLAEINHKMTCGLEDELTGNYFGMMRYLPFTRGLKWGKGGRILLGFSAACPQRNESG